MYGECDAGVPRGVVKAAHLDIGADGRWSEAKLYDNALFQMYDDRDGAHNKAGSNKVQSVKGKVDDDSDWDASSEDEEWYEEL
eukprot:377882-Prorocentrum_minimum.AAC.1